MSVSHSQHPGNASCFASLTPLLQPRSVAVVGASSDPHRIGGRPIAYMLRNGFSGRILPVNPNRSEIQGLPAFASVEALPEAPDVAIVALPAPQVLETIQALGRKGARSAIVFSSGFSEVGGEGVLMQEAMVEAARAANMRLLGPNALGVFNANLGYYAFFSTSLERGIPLAGRVGIATQSGAYGAHLLGLARQRGLGTPICVATGNEADVTLGDAIGWLVESPEVDVVMAYAESIRNVDSFLAALAAAHRAGKPVILHKVGRSELGGRAAMSHTASLAGDDKVLDAVLADYAVVRARNTEELIDIAYLATQRIYPVANSLGMITVSGGAGIIVSDAAEDVGLPMPPMPEAAQARLKQRLSFASPINPVDCTAQALNDLSLVHDFTESMVVDGGYKSLIAFFTQAGTVASIGPQLAEQFGQIKADHPDRLFVVSVMGEGEELEPYRKAGFALFEDPTRAVHAIQAMGRLGEAFAKPLRQVPAPGGVELPPRTPGEAEAKQLLARAGIESAPERVLVSAGEAAAFAEQIGFPVVLKIASADILHKSEIGGVLLGVDSAAAVREGFDLLLQRAAEQAPQARIDGVLVARQLQGGVECFMGIQRDPLFGPVALFGLGGIFVEVLKDVVFRRCPFGAEEAEAMIRSIKGAPLLLGARGRPVTDVKALAQVLSRLSQFAAQAGPRLRSVDLNPVFAMPEGQGAWAADAVLEVQEVAHGAES
ncbi:acetate--CoA ligase family protein [Pseudomonas citronellolis]|uniref:Acetate--CoA ligase family protein n=1 Tax=Pseudomonas citronellolis TaxID=53408 RepID=A0AAW6PIB3_9PSED|nr:acetate--CoA ligase family protein [Pseudomonas citronellolis]MDF3845951.1 acetate--CoA ligase family protein [Pseudomonas citronellolis]